MLPGGAGRHRAAAQLAEGGLEGAHAGLERGKRVREALPARVVEVRGELHVPSSPAARSKNAFTWRGLAMPVVSPKATSSQPASARRRAMPSTRSSGTSPS